jgi:hypothetical protein
LHNVTHIPGASLTPVVKYHIQLAHSILQMQQVKCQALNRGHVVLYSNHLPSTYLKHLHSLISVPVLLIVIFGFKYVGESESIRKVFFFFYFVILALLFIVNTETCDLVKISVIMWKKMILCGHEYCSVFKNAALILSDSPRYPRYFICEHANENIRAVCSESFTFAALESEGSLFKVARIMSFRFNIIKF